MCVECVQCGCSLHCAVHVVCVHCEEFIIEAAGLGVRVYVSVCVRVCVCVCVCVCVAGRGREDGCLLQ